MSSNINEQKHGVQSKQVETSTKMVDMKNQESKHHSEKKTLLQAINFAAIKHRDQRRKDPENTPYINHPIGVANIISEEGNITDLDILISAVLHDTVEDTDTTFEEIEIEFGKKVRDIVDECSDDKTLSYHRRKKQQIEHAPHCSYEAKVVKLADKLYNLRDLERETPLGWTEKRVQDYFIWAASVCNGLRGVCQPLEDELDKLFDARSVLVK